MSDFPAYTIEFLLKRGCPVGVVEDMARLDGCDIIAGKVRDSAGALFAFEGTTTYRPNYPSEPGQDGAYLWARLKPRHRNSQLPTMARWASFMVGARLQKRDGP